MLTCREVTERANDYVDGEFGFWASMEVRFHLFACKYCRGFVGQMRTVVGLVRRREEPSPSAEIDGELLTAFREKTGHASK